MTMHNIVARRICWPNPDAVCLEGGCGYCNMSPYRDIEEIEAYARAAGDVGNRGNNKLKPSWQAYTWGLERKFCNADVRYASG
ncbi:hypothetical protein SEA_ROYALG_87 [Gordonia phage RoyalG]|uniref:Uncharacterized protein n=1 Tax=Gordonia phage RoyalG TaxID=2805837 RepID=A0A890V3J1_9CAUD|nr:hypothetical protein SEA_DIABLA_92 [Gordonia phage Diabla]QRI45671.1 hypothetical protein SEA_ROYALG_87 [Gordonia phage RoyalG]